MYYVCDFLGSLLITTVIYSKYGTWQWKAGSSASRCETCDSFTSNLISTTISFKGVIQNVLSVTTQLRKKCEIPTSCCVFCNCTFWTKHFFHIITRTKTLLPSLHSLPNECSCVCLSDFKTLDINQLFLLNFKVKMCLTATADIVTACFNTLSGKVCLYHHGSRGGGVCKVRLQTFHQHIIHPHWIWTWKLNHKNPKIRYIIISQCTLWWLKYT